MVLFESYSSHRMCLIRQECAPNDANSMTVLCTVERSGIANSAKSIEAVVESSRNVMAHGDARDGK